MSTGLDALTSLHSGFVKIQVEQPSPSNPYGVWSKVLGTLSEESLLFSKQQLGDVKELGMQFSFIATSLNITLA